MIFDHRRRRLWEVLGLGAGGDLPQPASDQVFGPEFSRFCCWSIFVKGADSWKIVKIGTYQKYCLQIREKWDISEISDFLSRVVIIVFVWLPIKHRPRSFYILIKSTQNWSSMKILHVGKTKTYWQLASFTIFNLKPRFRFITTATHPENILK